MLITIVRIFKYRKRAGVQKTIIFLFEKNYISINMTSVHTELPM